MYMLCTVTNIFIAFATYVYTHLYTSMYVYACISMYILTIYYVLLYKMWTIIHISFAVQFSAYTIVLTSCWPVQNLEILAYVL